MTISIGTVGALATGTTTVTPALVGAAGDLAVLQVVSGHPSDSVPSTPSGWTSAGSFSGGGGTFGTSAGPRRITYFVRVLTGGEAAPTTSIPAATGSVISGRVMNLTRSAGTGWRWAAAFGEDTLSGTGFSATSLAALTFTAGDVAVIGYGVASNADSYTAEALTATGITFGTVTERADAVVAAGNGASVALATATVTAGSGSQTPTVAATLAAASTGVAGVLRVREASAVLTATPQSVFPPRNLVAATGLTSDDIVTATLYRQVGNNLTPVRAATGVDVSTASSLLRVDAEQPLGVPVTYIAYLTDVNGAQWIVGTSSPLTSTAASDIISDAVRGTGAAVKIESPLEFKRDRDATTFNVGGRLVVVGKPRSAPTTTMTVRTETDEDGDDLSTVLDNATEGILLVRKQGSLSRLDGAYALLDDTESPNWYDEYRWFALSLARTEDWPDSMEAAGYTLQDIANNYSTLADLAADFGSLLAIALFDFGG
ncbi:hypothetical protein ACFZC3_15540 [Streptomyces sp. NPDC007903]|uniref:hypothetical protein n=1 Tax=Streptomyces sp. NPDC007903 TaxID=3364786 RepID=UPI0036E6AE4A